MEIKDFVANFFNIPPSSITNESGIARGDIEGWDSLSHLNLILAIEENYKIQFDMDEIFTLNTFEKIEKAVKR